MKKTFATIGVCFSLSACLMQTNLDKAAETRAEHLEADRLENGCQLTDDHASYRNCLMNTYYKSKPKTYVSARDEKGKALAIIRNEATSSYDEKTGAYKTERVIVIETEEKLVPTPEGTVITEEDVVKPVVETVEEVAAPVKEEVKTTEEVKVTEVKQETTETQPVKEESWWERYQKNREPAKEVKCPCEDPNDPCPQCVDK